jgi:succinyl-diaminopimelate desuccinylase
MPNLSSKATLPETPDAVELTRRLIAFDTINPPGRERACAEFLAGLLSNAGFHIGLKSFGVDRTNLLATRGGADGALPLVFTGHIDVVPLGSRGWRHGPFSGAVVDGRLYGRGSSDMKSGIAAFVTAAIAEADRLGDGQGISLIITGGEEAGCEGASALAATDALGRAGALVVGEPTANLPYVGHKGALWLKAVASGVTAHGSMPEQGDNAAYKAARVITRLSDFDFNVARHPVLGNPTLNVGTVQGGMNINSVPDRTEIGVDIRTIPGIDHASLQAVLKGYMGEDVDIEVLVDLPGVWTSPDQPWAERVSAIVGKIVGRVAMPTAATYFTDASVLTPAFGGVPTIVLGPGEPTQAHQTDEWCDVARIRQAVDIYRGLITDWMQNGGA